ncbi:MAG: PD-(D/E)XK nuclease family protein, partial [Candidatus Margulisbacteria bacterium]|nr:PD-(D/E)XK nuclease family protein [Candidatus Margulisiibacteriota bacterium]
MNSWSSEGFISREHEEQRLTKAKKALNRFFKQQSKSKSKIKYVEESFSIPKDNIIVRGRWDRVDEQNGKAFIIDYKTSEVKDQKDADQKARKNDQLTLYALAWVEKFKQLPKRVELYFIESGLIGSTRRDAKDIAKVWDKILKVGEGIRKAKFAATPNQRACSYCPYSEICPASVV